MKSRRNRKKTNRADYYGYSPEEVRAFRRLDEFADMGWTPAYSHRGSTETHGSESPTPKNPRGYVDMARRGYKKVERDNRFECWEHPTLGVVLYLDSTDYRKFIMGAWLQHGLVTVTVRFLGRPIYDFVAEIERLAREGKLVCSTCGKVMKEAAHKEMAWRFCHQCWEGSQ